LKPTRERKKGISLRGGNEKEAREKKNAALVRKDPGHSCKKGECGKWPRRNRETLQGKKDYNVRREGFYASMPRSEDAES